jgi:hypothetical protein
MRVRHLMIDASPSRRMVARSVSIAVSLWLVAGPGAAQRAADQKFPDIVAVKVTPRGADVFDFDVTVSSPYDTAERYADAFRALGADGRMLGERILLHDHADEQPFTRDLHGVRIPPGVRAVTIQGRDKANGWGGKTFEATLPGR